MVPLFAKYQTESGSCFVYDICTGEILRVGNIVYHILDDYHLLTADEICEKYSALTEPEHICEALMKLDEAQAQGLLCDHAPEISVKVESACYQGKPESVRDFLRHRRRQLTLEVTHQCNLACEYCVYGRHYDQTRQRNDMPMSLDTAKHAIARFLSHKPKRAVIGFYGGEPLIEFELMRDIVAFAEELAAQSGVEAAFNITTNGTLLSDEKIHFLVAHKFAVFISLDGNKETHDRYRVFKGTGNSEERKGSYDVVVRNMERFVELYPDYISRGIALTLTATTNLSEVEQFVRQWKPLFPSFSSSPVAPVTSRVEATRAARASIQLGDCRTLACSDESCIRRHPHHKQLRELPDFDDWSRGGLQALEQGLCHLLAKLRHSGDMTSAQQICDDAPISVGQLRTNIEHIHHRPVIGDATRKHPVTRLSCFPGAVRTYVSSQGAMFPCEKIDFGKLFVIGDAVGDIDADKACDFLVEMVRLGCDCGNCILTHLCALCPAQVTESRELPGYPDFLALQGTCGQLASEAALTAHLRRYTVLIETNPEFLDKLLPRRDGNQANDDWLGHTKLVTAKQEPIEVGVEELAGFV